LCQFNSTSTRLLAAEGNHEIETHRRVAERRDFVGAKACLDCHRSEFVAWLGTKHFDNEINRLDENENSLATRYKKRVGNLTICKTCHSVPAEDQFGRITVVGGTSCESCHGAAGGPDGWLNRHAVYGPNITSIHQETPQHYARRVNSCEQAGMVRPANQYTVAKNCFSCHIIGYSSLINDDVGHPAEHEDFYLLEALPGEVRHNFHMDQRHNAATPTLDTMRRGLSEAERKRVYLILGALAKMEVALEYITQLPDSEAEDLTKGLGRTLAGLVDDASGDLEDYLDVLEEPEEEDIPPLSEEDVAPLWDVVDAFEEYDDLDEPTRADAAEFARLVAESAHAFLVLHPKGEKLGALDSEFIEYFSEPIGKALEP